MNYPETRGQTKITHVIPNSSRSWIPLLCGISAFPGFRALREREDGTGRRSLEYDSI